MNEEQALARLRDVLARPDYQQGLNRPWWEQLLQPVWDILTYVFVRLVQTIMDAAGGREGMYGLGVLAVCLVLIGLVGMYLLRAIRLSMTAESRTNQANLAERRERSERLWHSAHQLAGSGQLVEATRRLYLSALYALDERALLHVDASLTNREHARALDRLHPRAAQTFSAVVDRYDRLRYGTELVSSDAFGDLSRLVARSRTAALDGTAA